MPCDDITMLTKEEISYLRLFKKDTYGISIPHTIAKKLEEKGLIEWAPPKFGARLYMLTEKGKRPVEIKAIRNEDIDASDTSEALLERAKLIAPEGKE